MSRLPPAVLGVLVVATVGAFFVTQHLKVTTPLLSGSPAPDPAVIDPVAGGTCNGSQHRVSNLSFYLLNRSDDVDVYVIDQGGNVVDTLASDRHMRRGVRNPDGDFAWDGRESGGQPAPAGTYYFQVSLIHQGRTVVISNAAGPEPITVESAPPRPRVLGVSPPVVPRGGRISAVFRYVGNDELGGSVNLYRTDLPGAPRLAKTFGMPWGAHSVLWDGRINGRPAPVGTYVAGLALTDGACVTARSMAAAPRVAVGVPHAGLSVRYLAAAPPLDPIAAGSRAAVRVESGVGAYSWSLRRVGARSSVEDGTSQAAELSVPLPAGRAGLYELRLRSRRGRYSTTVPLAAGAPSSQPALVVLPALSWQGLNPVDDSGDGVPNTLPGGGPVALARVFANGLPPGFADEAGMAAYLDSAHRGYDLTTDLGLLDGVGPQLSGHSLVVLAGSEQWLPASLAARLRAYVAGGGHVLSVGIDSLRRSVTVRGNRALDPSAPARVDALGAMRAVAVSGAARAAARAAAATIRPLSDQLGLFRGAAAAGVGGGFSSLQAFTAPGPVLSSAGPAPAHAVILAYRVGRGIVIDVGIGGFGSALARNRGARALVDAVWELRAG